MKQKYKIYLSEEAVNYFEQNKVPMSYIANHILITQSFELINTTLLRSTPRSLCKPVNITLGPYANQLFNQLKEENRLPISPMKYVPVSLSRVLEFVYSYDILNEQYDDCLPLLKSVEVMNSLNYLYINCTYDSLKQIKELLNELYNL